MATLGKFHITKNGIPERCKANKGRCPYSSTGHFETQAEAASVSDNLLESKYGAYFDNYSDHDAATRTLETTSYVQANYRDVFNPGENQTLFQNIMSDLTENKNLLERKGLSYESFGAYAYAEEMKLDESAVIKADGTLSLYTSEKDDLADSRFKAAYDNALTKITNNLKSKGIEVNDPSKIIKAIHYSKDGSKVVAQMGGSDVLDIAVIDGDKVDIIEFKKMSATGAQTSSQALRVDENGNPLGDLSKIAPEIQEKVKDVGFSWTIGTNYPVNITKRQSLEYIVDTYKDKGASKLSYLTKNGSVVEIDLSDSTESVVKSLENNNIEATLRMRSNMAYNVPSKKDKERWRNKRREYFKSNEFPTGTFKLSDIKKKYANFESCGGKATIGELVLPYSKSQLAKLPPDTEINIKDLKVRGLTLIGSIKEIPSSRILNK